MSEYLFLFDLDATVTNLEILPELAKQVNSYDAVRRLTEKTMKGEIPFKTSFLQRVEALKTIPVSQACEIVRNISLNEKIVGFIRRNKDQCRIVTGNLDVWIAGLLERLEMSGQCFSSHALVENDRIKQVTQIISKIEVAQSLQHPLVVIGDGDNDAEIVAVANIGIGYGGVRPVAPSIIANADFIFYSEEDLCRFLEQLL